MDLQVAVLGCNQDPSHGTDSRRCRRNTLQQQRRNIRLSAGMTISDSACLRQHRWVYLPHESYPSCFNNKQYVGEKVCIYENRLPHCQSKYMTHAHTLVLLVNSWLYFLSTGLDWLLQHSVLRSFVRHRPMTLCVHGWNLYFVITVLTASRSWTPFGTKIVLESCCFLRI